MSILRPVTPDDHDFVLDLNQRNVEVLSPLDRDRLAQVLAWADRADIIEHDGRRAGFVLTFTSGSAYDSTNYRWFDERFERFYYLDRIVLDDDFRRHGLGRAAYDELERVAADHGRMVLEVDIEPANRPSLAFHQGRGYAEVGRQGVQKVVALMELGLSGSNPGRSGAAASGDRGDT